MRRCKWCGKSIDDSERQAELSAICSECDKNRVERFSIGTVGSSGTLAPHQAKFDQIIDADELIRDTRIGKSKSDPTQKDFAIGFVSYHGRNDEHASALVMLQVYVKGMPILVLRDGDSVILMRFKDQEIPTENFREIDEERNDKMYLLGNGQFIMSFSEMNIQNSMSVKAITKIIKKHLKDIGNPKYWVPTIFRKRKAISMIITMSTFGTTVRRPELSGDSQRLLT